MPTNRRELLAAAFAGSALAQETPSRPRSSFALAEVSLAQLAAGLKSGQYTARSLTQSYLTRIAQIDRSGPGLRSVLETNPDALSIADALDRERKQKGPRGPLHGIPILVKDNIDTADRMTTTAGSLALEGSIATKDSFVAARLRAAGAILLGKTNLSEWANFRSTHSSSGWSGRGGQTRNPYALDRNPCGSSSGSGVAVSANLCAAAIGTETDGSIVCPSALNGVIGIKPTVGLVSRSGIIPISHTQDTAGPMARSVADAAILLGALTGVDPSDAVTQTSQGKALTDYTRFLDPNGLKGARIGVARKFFGYNRDVDKLVESCIAEMKSAGAEIVDPADLPTHGQFNASELEVLLYEFKADLNKYLAGLPPPVKQRTLADLIDFNEKHAAREMPYFGQELFIQAEAKGPLTDNAYTDALANDVRLSRAEGIDVVLTKNNLQAIIAPAGGPAWLTDLVTGDHDAGGSSTPAAVAGYPNISVPCGSVFGMPIGLSFFGAAYTEPVLIKLAYAFEQLTKARQQPRFLPSAQIS